MLEQSPSLIRFIAGLNLHPDNTIVLNKLDTNLSFVSRFYTPHFKVSILGKHVLEDVTKGVIPSRLIQTEEENLTTYIQNSDLRTTHPMLYTLARAVVLETFSLVYTLNDRKEYIRFLDEEDVQDTRETIKYLCDALAKIEKYNRIVKGLQDLDIHLGYIQKEIPAVREGTYSGPL